MTHQESLTAYIAAFVAELVNTGITEVVVSPGSRSTPMAMVMAEHPDLHIHIHVDASPVNPCNISKGNPSPQVST